MSQTNGYQLNKGTVSFIRSSLGKKGQSSKGASIPDIDPLSPQILDSLQRSRQLLILDLTLPLNLEPSPNLALPQIAPLPNLCPPPDDATLELGAIADGDKVHDDAPGELDVAAEGAVRAEDGLFDGGSVADLCGGTDERVGRDEGGGGD
jgi:hypothetical protein